MFDAGFKAHIINEKCVGNRTMFINSNGYQNYSLIDGIIYAGNVTIMVDKCDLEEELDKVRLYIYIYIYIF